MSRSGGGDISAIIPNKIDTDHNQVTANLNFTGKKGYAQVGYYGSYFTNNVTSMSWQNWKIGPSAAAVQTMSSAPSNTFVQFSGTAGVKISAATKLVVDGAYGRGTQNEVFLTDASTPVVPGTSLHGLVANTLLHAKLTARPAKSLHLAAAFRYNNRDNQTPVNIYQYADAGETPEASALFPAGSGNPLGPVLAQNANANRPYSREERTASFDADYSIASGQWITVGDDFQRLNRSCPGSWISCADAGTTNENTVRAEWRTMGYLITGRVDYAYSTRRSPDYNENAFLALVPYANVSPIGATDGATAYAFMIMNGWNGWGPAAGYAPTTGNANLFFPSNNALANAAYANNNRISELVGMRRYYVADRNRQKLRGTLMWQATDALSFESSLDLNNDDYPTTVYGLQHAKNWAVNTEGTYAVSADLSADVFYTYENELSRSTGNSYTGNSNASTVSNAQPGAVGLSGGGCNLYTTLKQRNNDGKVSPCLNWFADMPTKTHTAGVELTKKTDRVELTASAIFSRVRWNNDVTGGTWANNPLNGPGGPPTTIAAFFIAATPVPPVTTTSGELRLGGKVAVAAHQWLRAAYAFLHMASADYAFEGVQTGVGTISGVLPTNEQPFNYNVNMVSVSYTVAF